jgi:phosphatidylinositol-3-phosphatase
MHPRHGLRVFVPLLLTTLACSSVSQVLRPPSSATPPPPAPTPSDTPTRPPDFEPPASPTVSATATGLPNALVPDFQHIVIVVFENKEFGTVIGNPQMPYFNELAKAHTLLTQHYAVAHPSLPNYLALIGGDTFGVTFDCTKCIFDAVTLPDLIEAGGRTWKSYQEDMPSPCFAGAEAGNYAMKHNPFMYFDPIRLDAGRCTNRVVPMQQLYVDLAAGNLPNYSFITPNLCNDAHDCGLGTADDWLKSLMMILLPLLGRDNASYLVILTWDEGQGDHSCCGLPAEAGGKIATVLISPQAKTGFEDDTPYTHYSILKTISEAWHLEYLGHAADADNVLITAPWH